MEQNYITITLRISCSAKRSICNYSAARRKGVVITVSVYLCVCSFIRVSQEPQPPTFRCMLAVPWLVL